MKHVAAGAFKPFPGISEQIYSREDFENLREIIYNLAGIVMAPEKSTLIYSRVAPLVRESGEQTFARYIAAMRKDKEMLRRTVNVLTTNHTFFYRERHHFDHLSGEVRSALLTKAQRGEPVRIWSAGCSTGEELYSLTMALLGKDRAEAKIFLNGDVLILATDLADHAVAGAKQGTYDTDSLKDVPAELVRLWTQESNGVSQMKEEVRSLIRVKRLNLLQEWPMKRRFDVIFCRNVMIYFDQSTKERLVTRFVDNLLPGGHLYIGHSERACGPAEKQLTVVAGTTYRKDRP